MPQKVASKQPLKTMKQHLSALCRARHWPFLRGTFLGFTLSCAAASLHAQSVRWESGSGTLALNQPNELRLVFDQCEPSGSVTPPTVTGIMLGTPNRSESTSFNVVNFKATRTRTVTLTYRVRPTERTSLTIAAFTVETDKGTQRVVAATFQVGDATTEQTGTLVNDVTQARSNEDAIGEQRRADEKAKGGKSKEKQFLEELIRKAFVERDASAQLSLGLLYPTSWDTPMRQVPCLSFVPCAATHRKDVPHSTLF